MRSSLLLLLGAACLFGVGCGGSDSTQPQAKGPEILLVPKTKKELDEHIASQKGKVVLLDVWAMW